MNVFTAINAATERARQSWMRQVNAAKHCIGGEKRRQQLKSYADNAQRVVDDLVEANQIISRAYEEMGKAASFLNALGREDRAAPLRRVMAEMQSPVEPIEGRPQ